MREFHLKMKNSSYLAFIGLLFVLSLQADRIYVSSTAAEGGDRTSWATAYRFLQDGLDIRTSCNGYILFAWPGLRTYVELVLISITNCINRAFLLHVL